MNNGRLFQFLEEVVFWHSRIHGRIPLNCLEPLRKRIRLPDRILLHPPQFLFSLIWLVWGGLLDEVNAFLDNWFRIFSIWHIFGSLIKLFWLLYRFDKVYRARAPVRFLLLNMFLLFHTQRFVHLSAQFPKLLIDKFPISTARINWQAMEIDLDFSLDQQFFPLFAIILLYLAWRVLFFIFLYALIETAGRFEEDLLMLLSGISYSFYAGLWSFITSVVGS